MELFMLGQLLQVLASLGGPLLLLVGVVLLCDVKRDWREPIQRRRRDGRVLLLWFFTLLPSSVATLFVVSALSDSKTTGLAPPSFRNDYELLGSILSFASTFLLPFVGWSVFAWFALLLWARSRLSPRHRAALVALYGAMWSLIWVSVALSFFI